MINEKKLKKIEKLIRKKAGDKATFIFVVNDGDNDGGTAYGICSAKDGSTDSKATGLGCACLGVLRGVKGTIAKVMGDDEEKAGEFIKAFVDSGDGVVERVDILNGLN